MKSVSQLSSEIRNFRNERCILCQSKKKKNLVNSNKPCYRIRDAAKKRQDGKVLSYLSNFNKNELFFIHMTDKCYRSYVNKINIVKYVKKLTKVNNVHNGINNTEYNLHNSCENMNSEPSIENSSGFLSAEHSCNTSDNDSHKLVESVNILNNIIIKENNEPLNLKCIVCDQTKKNALIDLCRFETQDRANRFLKIVECFGDQFSDRAKKLKSPMNMIIDSDIVYHKDCLRAYELRFSLLHKNKEKKQFFLEKFLDPLIMKLRAGESFNILTTLNQLREIDSFHLKICAEDIINYVEEHHNDLLDLLVSPMEETIKDLLSTINDKTKCNEFLESGNACFENPPNISLEDFDFVPNERSSPINHHHNSKIMLIKDICIELIPRLREGDCFSLSDIAESINNALESTHLRVENSDIEKYLMENYFEEIEFCRHEDRNKPILIHHSSISKYQLLEVTRKYDPVKDCARILRNSISSYDFNLENRFCDAPELQNSYENMKIPSEFLRFLSLFLEFDKEKFLNTSSLTGRFKQQMKTSEMIEVVRIKSLFQQMFFLLHKGNKLTPFHVMTGIAIHSICKCRYLIKTLNHTGVSICYDKVQRIRTAFAAYTLEQSENSMPLPLHFHPEKFTIVAFDNFDHCEATFTGAGSTHDTVSVLFQDISKIKKGKPYVSETTVDSRNRTFDEDLECQKLIDFTKPANKIMFPHENSSNFNELSINVDDYKDISTSDFAWYLSRMSVSDNNISYIKRIQEIPSWTAFHSYVTSDSRPLQAVGFLPVLPFPVTEYSTVYTAMCNFKKLKQQLQQSSLPVACDEGVYRIAKHIQLCRHEEFSSLFLMLGTFHMAKNALSGIGKYVKGFGFEQVLIETGTFGSPVVDQVFNATNYARSFKGFLLLSEALTRLQIESFFSEKGIINYEDELTTIELLQIFISEDNGESCKELFQNISREMRILLADFIQFVKQRRNESELFKFADNIIRSIRLVTNLVKSDRQGLYDLHVNSIKMLLPFFHMVDHQNYTRYASLYLSDLQQLQHKHPEIYKQFLAGKFSIKRSATPFTSVGVDQALEQTINRSQKSTSGIIGSTKQKSFCAGWNMNYHEVLYVTNTFRDITHSNSDNYELDTHHEFSKSYTDELEKHVQNIISYIKKHANPFMSGSQPLRNLCTQELCSSQVSNSLLNIFETGCNLFNKFWSERFVEKKVPLSHKITRQNLPTFEKQKVKEVQKIKKSVAADSSVGEKCINLARARNFPFEELLKYELFPNSMLFESEKLLKKYDSKSELALKLIKKANVKHQEKTPNSLSDRYCMIVDVMLICRMIKFQKKGNFSNFADNFCNLISCMVKHTPKRIDFVFDSYFKNSPKSGERLRRYSSQAIPIHNIEAESKLPKIPERFWASSENKVLLQKFLREYITSNAHSRWPGSEIVFSSTENELCEIVCSQNCQNDLIVIETSHIEEADVRLMRHILHASKNYDKVVVLSTDTDVLVMLLHHFETFEANGLKELWRKESKKRFLPVHEMCSVLKLSTRQILTAVHHLTGADYTSKVGTKLKGLKANPEKYLHDFATGTSKPNIEKSIGLAEKYLVQVLYKGNSSTTFDELRYWLYYHGKKSDLSELPPTSASMRLHILRSFFATHMQITCLKNDYIMKLEAEEFGYEKHQNHLYPQRNLNILPPPEKLQPECNCKNCSRTSCRCSMAGMSCCRFCTCQINGNCFNSKTNN